MRDAHGAPVAHLEKPDFELFDNGKPQTISSFSETDLAGSNSTASESAPSGDASARKPPTRYIALLFDDMNTGAANFTFLRHGAEKFIRESTVPEELIGIFTSSGDVFLDFTNDKQKLLDALSKVIQHLRMSNQGAMACPAMSPYAAWVITHLPGHTDEFESAVTSARRCCPSDPESCARIQADAVISISEGAARTSLDVVAGVVRYLSQMPGRRILLLASSSFLTKSLGHEQEKILETALRAQVIINSLDARGVMFASVDDSAMGEPMSILARGTGGKYFHGNNDLFRGYKDLAESPTASYFLGFSPDDVRHDGSLHNLKVTLINRAGRTVEARPGYYAPVDEPPATREKVRRFQEGLTANDAVTEIPVELTTETETAPTGDKTLKVRLRVDVHLLPFKQMHGRKTERLIFVTALFNSEDQFLSGVESVMDLNLKNQTLAQLSSSGLIARMSLEVKPGTYRLRQVVQETATGQLSSISRPLVVH